MKAHGSETKLATSAQSFWLTSRATVPGEREAAANPPSSRTATGRGSQRDQSLRAKTSVIRDQTNKEGCFRGDFNPVMLANIELTKSTHCRCRIGIIFTETARTGGATAET